MTAPDRDYYFDTYKPDALRKMLAKAKACVKGTPEPTTADECTDAWALVYELEGALNVGHCLRCRERPCTGHSEKEWNAQLRELQARSGAKDDLQFLTLVVAIIAGLCVGAHYGWWL